MKLYTNIKGNLEELDKFLGRNGLPRPNWEDAENKNRPVTNTETETVIEKLQKKKKKSRTRWLHGKILPSLYRRVNTLFKNIAEEGTLPNSFYEALITLILKPC